MDQEHLKHAAQDRHSLQPVTQPTFPSRKMRRDGKQRSSTLFQEINLHEEFSSMYNRGLPDRRPP